MTGRARALPPAREYLLTLAAGAAGAAIMLVALRQGWAQVVTRPPAPLPASDVTVNGQALVPLAGALAWAALATLGAVIATRAVARRLAGAVLAALGAVAGVTAVLPVTAAAVAAVAHGSATPAAGSVTGSGAVAGAGGTMPSVSTAAQVMMTAFGWRAAAVLGAALVIAAGAAVAWRGARWPVMSGRYERPEAGPRPGGDAASMWDSLSRGADPTEADGAWPGTAR